METNLAEQMLSCLKVTNERLKAKHNIFKGINVADALIYVGEGVWEVAKELKRIRVAQNDSELAREIRSLNREFNDWNNGSGELAAALSGLSEAFKARTDQVDAIRPKRFSKRQTRRGNSK